jgi:hypothetical protein
MKPLRSFAFSSPRAREVLVLVAILASSAIATTGCDADNAVVGGSCATGYTQCDLVCVDTTDNPNNCGQCGIVCADAFCVGGRCSRAGDASHEDGSSDATTDASRDGRETDASADGRETEEAPRDGRAKEGSTADGATMDATNRDGAPTDSATVDVGTDATPDSCTPPYDTNDSCGACGMTCGATDICVMGDAGTYQCVPLCSPLETDCSGSCVDETSDSNNCGRCGKVCPSGFCSSSACEGTTEGDIVVIGDDYNSAATVPSGAKLLTNAVFLPTSYPIQVLSFEEYADPVSVSNVKAILNAEVGLTGHKINVTVSNSDSDIPANLTIANYDVLLMYDQEAADPGVLGPLGASWATALSHFTVAGGIVVSLDGAAGTTEEMPVFDTMAGLLAVSDHTVMSKNTPLDVVSGGDAIGHGVVSPYAAKPNSVFFTTSESNGGNVTYVVVDSLGQAPVVVHKEVP